MPLIALDGRKYFDFGIGTYIQHLVRQFESIQSRFSFLLFVTPGIAAEIVPPNGWKLSTVSYGKYSLSELLLFGRKIRSHEIDVFHSPHYTLPFGLKGRSIVTIHDLIHLRFPQYFSVAQRAYSYGMISHALRNSRFIITDTDFTKNDILRSFRVPDEKIITIPLGVSEEFRRIEARSSVNDFKRKHRLDLPYILFVGNTKPHKGLPVLLEAFKTIAASNPDLMLVFVGGSLAVDKDLQSLINGSTIANRVRSLGRLSNEELVLAYNGAEIFVLPSLYEGFGLPALEAMACEVPVIVSNAGSLPEVVGDGALICESGNQGMFAEAIGNLLSSSALRKEIVMRGKKRAQGFSWSATARKTIEVYDKII